MDTWAVQLNAAMILVKRETHVFTANLKRGKAQDQEWGCQLHSYGTSNSLLNISEADCDNLMDFSYFIEEYLFFSIL